MKVASAGDADGDGRADLVIGAPWATSGFGPGTAYIVYGKPGHGAVELWRLKRNNKVKGYRIQGEDDRDKFGESVSAVGDFNGDGLVNTLRDSTLYAWFGER